MSLYEGGFGGKKANLAAMDEVTPPISPPAQNPEKCTDSTLKKRLIKSNFQHSFGQQPFVFLFPDDSILVETVEKKYRGCSSSNYILERIKASLPWFRARRRGVEWWTRAQRMVWRLNYLKSQNSVL
ncbi:hypothetical protein SDJN03_21077, partial [Cucurbita argyrosperma subsp. sororia]